MRTTQEKIAMLNRLANEVKELKEEAERDAQLKHGLVPFRLEQALHQIDLASESVKKELLGRKA